MKSSMLFIYFTLLITSISCTLQIVPGATWSAINTGKHIQAHGPGLFLYNKTYYLVGEDKSHGSSDPNVNCYSSPNLVEWTYLGHLFDRSQIEAWPIIERPKVLFNEKTKKFVLFMHLDSSDYLAAQVGVGIGDSPCGKYEFLGAGRPLGRESRDIGVYQEDGKGYLLSEDRPAGLRIYSLSDDYLSINDTIHTYDGDHIESPALHKHTDGTYFMFGSHLTGWVPNDNVYTTAKSLSGPWSPWKNFAPVGSRTYNSQVSLIQRLPDGRVMYAGDRWEQGDLSRSTYMWMPLDISGTNAILKKVEAWDTPMTKKGGRRELTFNTTSVSLINGAKMLSNGAAGYIGGPSNGTVVFKTKLFPKGDANARNTIRIYYRNGDYTPRYATVQIGIQGRGQKIAFLSTNNQVGISAFTADFVLANKPMPNWANNDIVISVSGEGWGPDIVEIRMVTVDDDENAHEKMVLQPGDMTMKKKLDDTVGTS